MKKKILPHISFTIYISNFLALVSFFFNLSCFLKCLSFMEVCLSLGRYYRLRLPQIRLQQGWNSVPVHPATILHSPSGRCKWWDGPHFPLPYFSLVVFVQLLSGVRLFVTPWTVAQYPSLSSWSSRTTSYFRPSRIQKLGWLPFPSSP